SICLLTLLSCSCGFISGRSRSRLSTARSHLSLRSCCCSSSSLSDMDGVAVPSLYPLNRCKTIHLVGISLVFHF
ncbi:hypothetical protein CICLE_v10030274mg, partial [Citrus x clementina]